MAETKPTRVLDATNSTESSSEQQYIEIGSNMYLGTKDGMKYTLIQTPDNKFRLVETLSENPDISRESLISSVKKEDHNDEIDEWITQRSGPKLIKLTAAYSEQSPCRGQGDEIGNTVVSPAASSSDFKDPDSIPLQNIPLDEIHQNIDRGSELTYTTLVPRQEKHDALNDLCYSSPSKDFYSCPPTFATPIAVRPTRYVRKPRPQFTPSESPCSPVPRPRGGGPKQRRTKQSMYQYNPQILHSTPGTESTTCTDTQMSHSGVSSGTQSADSYSECQSSMEYPRVPNNTPNSSESVDDVFPLQWVTSRGESYISLDPRESHNEKERKRRRRIKNACQSMRSLLPSVTEKTDNATVFEQAVYFIAYVRDAVGNGHDLEFLEQMFVL